MNQYDVERYAKMTEEEREDQLCHWTWFKNLKVDDEAILWLDGCCGAGYDSGYTLVKITVVNDDGSVQIDEYDGKFYYGHLLRDYESYHLVCLIPPTQQHLNMLHEQNEIQKMIDKLAVMKDEEWEALGFVKLKKIMDIIVYGRIYS